MDAHTDLPARTPAWQHRNLAAILSLWAIGTWLAVGSALASDWPPAHRWPTAEQVHAARSAAEGAGAVAVIPLVIGLVLAGRWRAYGWAIAFGMLLMFAVLGSALLVRSTASPVAPG